MMNAPGWNSDVKKKLEELMKTHAGKQAPVVFDFDNTIICGDIGEATLATLVKDHIITKDMISGALSPDFIGAKGTRVSLRESVDITAYYESLLESSSHQNDPHPLSSGYVWAVEIMQGLKLSDLVRATAKAFSESETLVEKKIVVTEGKTAYPIPFFYPEMIELIRSLIEHEFDVWIVSASNVWTVRWMVLTQLNPQLGATGIRPDRVVGVSTLLVDNTHTLFKDHLLVRTNPDYARLDDAAMANFTLTSKLNFPVSTYTGKVACIMDLIGKRPILAAGDSPGDLPMLSYCDNQLWIAREEKTDYQKAAQNLIATRGLHGTWLSQPTRCKKTPGFIRS